MRPPVRMDIGRRVWGLGCKVDEGFSKLATGDRVRHGSPWFTIVTAQDPIWPLPILTDTLYGLRASADRDGYAYTVAY